MVVASPWPLATSQSIVACLAAATSIPFRSKVAFALLTAGPSPRYASPSHPAGGWTVRTMGRSKRSANSQSRSSWPGTAMMAPVP